MNEKTDELLQQILIQQKEQTDLLRKNLGRIRFGLRALLLMMTFTCVALAFFPRLFFKPQPIPSRPVVPTIALPSSPVNFPNNMPMMWIAGGALIGGAILHLFQLWIWGLIIGGFIMLALLLYLLLAGHS